MPLKDEKEKDKREKRKVKVEDLPGQAKELSKDEMEAVHGGGFVDGFVEEVEKFVGEIVDGIENIYDRKH